MEHPVEKITLSENGLFSIIVSSQKRLADIYWRNNQGNRKNQEIKWTVKEKWKGV